MSKIVYIKSATLLPITGPPIPNGVLVIQNGLITNIGNESLLKGISQNQISDASDCIIAPGFVNAHAHLELSCLGKLEHPTDSRHTFTQWVKMLVEKKQTLDPEIKKSYYKKAIMDLAQSGVTTVLDHISYDFDLGLLSESELQIIPNAEVLGADEDAAVAVYRTILNLKDQYQNKHPDKPFFISPHAIYSLHPNILKKLLSDQSSIIFIHACESEDEQAYFNDQSGPLADYIKNRGIHVPDEHAASPIQILNSFAREEQKVAIVHGNYLTKSDLEIMKQRHWGLIHCPGSHNYFGHKKPNLQFWIDQGLTIGLGTDSLASNSKLDFLHELRLLRNEQTNISNETILQMATINGAKILGLESSIGSLDISKKAHLAFFKKQSKNPYEDILSATAIAPPGYSTNVMS